MDSKKARFIGCYNKSVILTYIGIISSIYGIIYSQNLDIAVICLVIAGICDLFDGTVARMCKRTDKEKEFGIQIDSLADVIGSLILPTAILNQVCSFDSNLSLIALIVSALYVLAGVTRLAWFNITTDGKTKYFQGLPVTSIAIFVPVSYVLLSNFIVSQLVLPIVLLVEYFIISFLFILNFKVAKPTKEMYVVFTGFAFICIILILLKWW